MKRFAALALFGSFPLVALAGPVSVHPPKPAAPPTSLNQPLSAAVQTAASNLPAPAPVMTSNPSWGSPAVFPGTLVPASGGTASCGPTVPCATAPCGDPATCQPVRPYLNLLAPRAGCDTARGSCLDKLKDWISYRSSPGGLACSPVPYRAPMRAYFPCPATDGCAGGACAGGTSAGRCGPAIGGTNCGTVTMPVSRLSATDCPAPACRPRVQYVPLLNRSECPTVGCDARPVRPRLFDRLLGLFTPTWGANCNDNSCAPADCSTPAVGQPMQPPPTTVNPPMVPPAPMPMPPMSTKPVYTPQSGNASGKTIQLTPRQPFTNP